MVDDTIVDWTVQGFTPATSESTVAAARDGWIPAIVPGTVAAALVAAGRFDSEQDLEAWDWWFRCEVPATESGDQLQLCFDGIATIGEIWLDGSLLLQTKNMWRSHRLVVEPSSAPRTLFICCRAMTLLLSQKHPRPRWKATGLTPQSIRWYRTSLLGRMPGISPVPPVIGPWRPVRLLPVSSLVAATWRTSVADGVGSVMLELTCGETPKTVAIIEISGAEATLAPDDFLRHPTGFVANLTLAIPMVELWWPATHGNQPTYPIIATIDGRNHELGRVGFRQLTADISDGGLRISVNDVDIFCRGAVWVPCDPIGLNAPIGMVRSALTALRDAGLNLVRINGAAVYEDDTFFDLCDELGLLVWQDLMMARFDPPNDAEWLAEVSAEVHELGIQWLTHPSLAVVCGGTEMHQQAGMLGLDAERRSIPVLEDTVRSMVSEALPEMTFIPSSPWDTGTGFAFRPDAVAAHYFGVGAYLMDVADARRAGVRFASECLAFAIPAEASIFDELGVPPEDRQSFGVPRDGDTPWDFADVTEHYNQTLWGLPSGDSMDRHRGAAAITMATAMTEWRRPESACRGAIVIASQDLVAGNGWGLLDADGHPKSAWWALRRVLSPLALLVTDEGLGGLAVHVMNDRGEATTVIITVELIVGQRVSESGARDLAVPGRGSASLDAEVALGGFRDLTAAFHFGTPSCDVVAVTARRSDGSLVGRSLHWPAGRPSPDPDIDCGLSGELSQVEGRGWKLTVSTTSTAQQVNVSAPGFIVDDSWFDLPAGESHVVWLTPLAVATEVPVVRLSELSGRAGQIARIESP